MIRIYTCDPHEPDLTLSGTWTPSRSAAVVGYVTLDVPQTIWDRPFAVGVKIALTGPMLVVDTDTWEILAAPWSLGAKVLPGPWLTQWPRGA